MQQMVHRFVSLFTSIKNDVKSYNTILFLSLGFHIAKVRTNFIPNKTFPIFALLKLQFLYYDYNETFSTH